MRPQSRNGLSCICFPELLPIVSMAFDWGVTMRIGLLIAVALVTLGASTSNSFAVSCTQQGGTCKTWASGQGADAAKYAAKCSSEVKACIARCKAGNKVFIGVYSGAGGGQNYPIDECK